MACRCGLKEKTHILTDNATQHFVSFAETDRAGGTS